MIEVFIKPIPESQDGTGFPPFLPPKAPPSRLEIAAWESAYGRLPNDYVDFLMAYNGGTVFPAHFDHKVIDAPEWLCLEAVESIDCFLTWDRFVQVNAFDGYDWRQDHVLVADCNSGGCLLLSMRAQDHGAVRYWPNNLAGWDVAEDGPLPVATVATTLRGFFATELFTAAENSTPRWHIPRDLATATKIGF
jgi:SMI1-KNR4 cell-wall